jgi:PGF-pre-PGF domain-containing protein
MELNVTIKKGASSTTYNIPVASLLALETKNTTFNWDTKGANNGTWKIQGSLYLDGVEFANANKTIKIGENEFYISPMIALIANQTQIVNAAEETDVILYIQTSNDTTGKINITKYDSVPSDTAGASFGLTALGKYVKIEPADSIYNNLTGGNLSWVEIRVYYTQAEVDTAGLKESSLKLRYFNKSTNEWEDIAGSDVNTTEVTINGVQYSGYVYANVTHFSYFGAGGNLEDTDADGIPDVNDNCPTKSGPASNNGCPTGSGGGGGGGGVTKGVIIKKIEEAGGSGTAVFDLEDTGYVSEITLHSKDTVYNVKVVAEALERKPYSSMPDPEGVVLSYIKLTKAGITNTQLEKAEVNFQVPLSWLIENDIAQGSVMLKRDAVSKWEDLETEYLSEDEEFAYYSAVTPGFSYFVITGDGGSGYIKPEEEVEEVAKQPEVTAPPVVTTTPPATTPPMEEVFKETEEAAAGPVPETEAEKGICGPTLITLLCLLPLLSRRYRTW